MDRRSVLQAITQVAILGALPATTTEAQPEPETGLVRVSSMVFRTDDERKIPLSDPLAPTALGTVYEYFREVVEMEERDCQRICVYSSRVRVLDSRSTGEKYIVVGPEQSATYHLADEDGKVVHLAQIEYKMLSFGRVTQQDRDAMVAALEQDERDPQG